MAETEPGSKRDRFLFIEPNQRAEAIAQVASIYPDDEIEAKIAPIRNEQEAIRATRLIMGGVNREIELLSDMEFGERNAAAFSKRRLELSRGASSFVCMEFPEGTEDFDFEAFYWMVDNVLEAGGFKAA